MPFSIKFTLFLIISGLISGISASQVIEANQSYCKEIKFERDASFGDTDDVFLGNIHAVAVDDRGRVYLADGDQTVVHVYNPDGSYKQSLGRQGSGPGEFELITPATHIRFANDQVFITDGPHRSPHRFHIFDAGTLTFIETRKLQAENKEDVSDELKPYLPNLIFPLTNGEMLVSYSHMFSPAYFKRTGNSTTYYVHDGDDLISSNEIFEHPDQVYLSTTSRTNRFYSRFFSFNRKPLFTVTGNEKIVYSWTESFKIDIYDVSGNHQRSITFPFENQELTADDIDESILRCDRGFDNGICTDMVREASHIPDTWPALNDLLVDDENRLWVSTIVEDFDVYEWWVLEESGEVITTFEWPRDEPIDLIKNGKMYTRQTDEETGLQQVVRYGIEME